MKYEFIIKNNIYEIPQYMRTGLKLYIERGIKPGSFLTAVLENDLVAACQHADRVNLRNIAAYAYFLYLEAPSKCWGSPEKVKTWCENHSVPE